MGAIIGFVLIVALVCIMIGIPAEIALIIGVISVVVIGVYIFAKDSVEQGKTEKREKKIKSSPEYSEYTKKYKKLINMYKTCGYYLKTKDDEWGENKHYAILDNGIHILGDLDEEDIVDIISYGGKAPKEIVYDIDEIRYYKLEGSVYQQQRISGGGGGGSSIKGAVVGGLVAGNAGAIIGSRKKIDNIQTTYEEEDDRRVVVTFVDDDELELPYKFYDRLLDYIPEKDYDNYIAEKKAKGRKK